jgi:hypothetical protein
MLGQLALPVLAAAALSLDRRAFMQCMLGRPLTTGAIVGAALGEPAAGLSLGLWTELLWLWRLTSGGYHTPDTPLALSAVLIALFGAGGAGPDSPQARAVLGFALVPALAHLLMRLDAALRRVAGRRSARLRERLGGQAAGGAAPSRLAASRAVRRAALAGVPETFLASLAALAAFIPAVRLLAAALAGCLPPALWAPLAAFAPYAPAAGLLGIASSLSRPYLAPYILGAAFALLLLAVLNAAGVGALP